MHASESSSSTTVECIQPQKQKDFKKTFEAESLKIFKTIQPKPPN